MPTNKRKQSDDHNTSGEGWENMEHDNSVPGFSGLNVQRRSFARFKH